jgi:hypothetical protein
MRWHIGPHFVGRLDLPRQIVLPKMKGPWDALGNWGGLDFLCCHRLAIGLCLPRLSLQKALCICEMPHSRVERSYSHGIPKQMGAAMRDRKRCLTLH